MVESAKALRLAGRKNHATAEALLGTSQPCPRSSVASTCRLSARAAKQRCVTRLPAGRSYSLCGTKHVLSKIPISASPISPRARRNTCCPLPQPRLLSFDGWRVVCTSSDHPTGATIRESVEHSQSGSPLPTVVISLNRNPPAQESSVMRRRFDRGQDGREAIVRRDRCIPIMPAASCVNRSECRP